MIFLCRFISNKKQKLKTTIRLRKVMLHIRAKQWEEKELNN